MEFIKLNEGWNAEPNIPNPQIDIFQNNLVLSFVMNSYQNDGDIGFILFKDVLKYRLGSPNDEDFYKGEFRYKSSQVNWGEFYKIKNSDFTNILHFKMLNQKLIGEDNLKHYIFFFRDNTFECIAKHYVLFIGNNFKAYCPYCGKPLIYNGTNLIGVECKTGYSIKMSQSLLVNIDLANPKEEDSERISTLSNLYCPKCSNKLYNSISNELVCLKCGFNFNKSQLHQLIELNPHL